MRNKFLIVDPNKPRWLKTGAEPSYAEILPNNSGGETSIVSTQTSADDIVLPGISVKSA